MRKSKIISLDEAYEEFKKSKVKKAIVPVKGHMTAGHFVKPYLRVTNWIVTFADGDRARVSGRTRREAVQNARQYSRSSPVKATEETEAKPHPGTRIFRTEDIKQ